MLKFIFDKLVRDKIVDQQIASGAKPKYRTLNYEAHIHALVNKIIEESEEIISAPSDELAGEIADVQQAIDDLVEKVGLTRKDITKAQQAKVAKAGAFKRGLYVEYVEVSEDDTWVAYYRKNANKYPEIN